MRKYLYNDYTYMTPQHICDHLFRIVTEVSLENDYTQIQVLSFLRRVLVATYEMNNMSQEDFNDLCDRMKKEFESIRSSKTDSTTPESQDHS